MKEYVVQYNNGRHSCGPIVLLNALRHQGHKATRRHLPWIAWKLRSKGNGIWWYDLDRVGREMGALTRLRRPSLDKLNAELVKGNAVAIRIGFIKHTEHGPEYSGHYLLLTAIWCHKGNISYYICNIGGRCKWMEFGDLVKFYDSQEDEWFLTHFWRVPRHGKKIRIPA